MLFREILVDPLLSRCVSNRPSRASVSHTLRLHSYSVIMIDEAHERSTYTDLLLGVLKKLVGLDVPQFDRLTHLLHRIRRVRPSLRVIISSATIEAQSFVDFFNTQPPPSSAPSSGVNPAEDILAPPPAKKSRWDRQEKMPKSEAVMVRLEGRSFPVEVAYLAEPTADLVRSVVETVFDIHLKVSRR